MKALIIAIATCLSALAATCRSQVVMDFLTVENGQIRPAGAAATVQDIAALAASNVAVAVSAQVVADTTAAVAGMVSNVTATVDALEGVMYWDGFVLDYGVAETVADTNYISRILRFDPGVATNETQVFADVYAYLSVAPEELPVIQFASTPERDGDWGAAELQSVVEDEILVGSTLYECFRFRIAHPLTYSTVYFRVSSQPVYSNAGENLPVENGISPGGEIPLTGQWTRGTNTVRVVGGILCEPYK